MCPIYGEYIQHYRCSVDTLCSMYGEYIQHYRCSVDTLCSMYGEYIQHYRCSVDTLCSMYGEYIQHYSCSMYSWCRQRHTAVTPAQSHSLYSSSVFSAGLWLVLSLCREEFNSCSMNNLGSYYVNMIMSKHKISR